MLPLQRVHDGWAVNFSSCKDTFSSPIYRPKDIRSLHGIPFLLQLCHIWFPVAFKTACWPCGRKEVQEIKRTPQTDHLSSMQWRGSDLSAHITSPFNICTCSHLYQTGKRGKIYGWIKFSELLCWKTVKLQYFLWLTTATLRISDLYKSLKLSLFCDVLFFKAHKYNHTSIFLSGICYDDCVVLLDVKNTEGSKLLIIILSKGKSKAFVWLLC